MAATINWTLNVHVTGGPKVSATDQVDVDAYDKLGVIVAPTGDGAGTELEVQPGGAGQVQFLLIKASVYHPSDLTYSVGVAEPDKTKRKKLDTLQVLIGDGAVELLGAPPDKLFFYNDLADEVSIELLVGRHATIP
jgi:hypothetical protein